MLGKERRGATASDFQLAADLIKMVKRKKTNANDTAAILELAVALFLLKIKPADMSVAEAVALMAESITNAGEAIEKIPAFMAGLRGE